jgi:GNAT superfamily N-acetyltransferase
MHVRRYQPADWDELLRLTQLLFPGDSSEAEAAGLRSSLARADGAVFVLDRGDGRLAGYVEAGERSIVDGCVTSPVGYIEAWYVDADVRRTGHGRRLLEAAEQWARERGHSEMGSDALLENDVSHAAHRASGYLETDRVINYRKELGPPPATINIRQAVPFFWVDDMQRSLRFYVDGLGGIVKIRWDVDGSLKWCWLEIGTASLMLQELSPDDPRRDGIKRGHGVSINFICADAITYYRELRSRNVEAELPFVGNSMWVTRATDPDGYELYFESRTSDPEESVYTEDSAARS